MGIWKDARGAPERETQGQRWFEGEPKRPKDPREQWPRPELNLQEHRGVRLGTWDVSRWSAGNKLNRFVRKAPERKRSWKQLIRSGLWSKASKGEAQERWRLKETSKVRMS